MILQRINYQMVLNVACQNQQLAIKYLNLFLEFAPAEVETINNMLLSKRSVDHKDLKIAFHTLKPKFGYLGLSDHLELCSILEKRCDEEPPDHKAIMEEFETLKRNFSILVADVKQLISSGLTNS